MLVVIPRYQDSLQRAANMAPKHNGALKTLLLGVLVRIQNNEVVPADEFKQVCGSSRYSDLVTRIDNPACLLVEVEHAEPPRIVQPPEKKPIAGAVGQAVNGSR